LATATAEKPPSSAVQVHSVHTTPTQPCVMEVMVHVPGLCNVPAFGAD
jgi:hypothetical protein